MFNRLGKVRHSLYASLGAGVMFGGGCEVAGGVLDTLFLVAEIVSVWV